MFEGVEEVNGFIGEVTDESTGIIDAAVTPGNIVAVRGFGLKVESDAAHVAQAGVFLVNANGTEKAVKAIALNEPRLLKLLMPDVLPQGEEYILLVRTQSPVRGGGNLLKDVREVRSAFAVTVQ
jgi:glycerol-3-phosphate responsive antiterminator